VFEFRLISSSFVPVITPLETKKNTQRKVAMMIVTIKKYGLRYEIEAMRTNELQITSKESINALESPISRLLRSFENLLTIFPLGVESK